MQALAMFGCIGGFILLAIIVYLNWDIMIASLVGTLFVIVTSQLPFTETINNIYFPGLASFFSSYLGMIAFGAMFAQMYSKSGAATSIALWLSKVLMRKNASQNTKQKIVLGIVMLTTFILTYGGVGAVLCVFVAYPVLLPLFKEADIPRKFAVAAMCAGSLGLGNVAPGAPVVPNEVCVQALGTTSTAGAIPGFVALLIELIFMIWSLNAMVNKSKNKGLHYDDPADIPTVDENVKRPNALISFIPLLVVLILYAGLKWNVVTSLCIGLALSVLFFYWYLPEEPTKYIAFRTAITTGVKNSLPSCNSMAAIMGFSAVMKSTAAFESIKAAIVGWSMPPTLLIIIMTAIMCAVVAGNATGLAITIPILGPMMSEVGYNMNALHRISCFAGSTLDTMPYSGAINLTANVVGTTIRECYPSVFMMTVVATAIGTVVTALFYVIAPGTYAF